MSISTEAERAWLIVSDSSSDDEDEPYNIPARETFCQKYTSCRWITAYMCCSARLAQSTLRQCMGMAVIVMMMPLTGPEVTSSHSVTDNSTLPELVLQTPEFKWSSEFEGLILSSFSFGYVASPIIGGYVAGKYGGKVVITVSLIAGSIITLATPVATRALPMSLVILRAASGIFMGTIEPSIQCILSKWAPKLEKASLSSCAYAGGYTLLCVFPWVLLVFDFPRDNPRIKETEVKLITRSHRAAKKDWEMSWTLWWKILTSPAVWAICAACISHTWVTSWVMAYLPQYMKQILKYDVEENGILSSVPYAGRLLVGMVSGNISDRMLSWRLLSTANIRKTFQVVGCFGCAACMLLVGFIDDSNGTLALMLLIAGISLQNCTSVAFKINHLDIAPRFAGVIVGMTISCAMTVSLSAPLITSYVIKEGTRQEWQIIFYIVGAVNVVGAGVFVVFGKGTERDWAKEDT
ncbi:sialin-like [Haliotis asinina]|uniref:sialin-like n=1 Tax=Haliotis asinina TaxID=109174 RepID=UPI0035322D1C